MKHHEQKLLIGRPMLSVIFFTSPNELPITFIIRNDFRSTGEYELNIRRADLEAFNEVIQFAANAVADEYWEYLQTQNHEGENKES